MNKWISKNKIGLFLFIGLIFSTSLSYANVIKIDQAAALAGGVTPGDAPGFPVTLSEPGSYKLTSNLDKRVAPNSQNVDAIEVTVDHVKIDLSGFSIIGGHIPGTGKGVSGRIPGSQFTTVVNGSIKEVGNDGLDLGDNASVQNVRIEIGNGCGVIIGNGSRVFNSIFRQARDFDLEPAGMRGICVNGASALIKNNIIEDCIQGGILSSPVGSGLVVNNVVTNSGTGIDLEPNSVLLENLVE